MASSGFRSILLVQQVTKSLIYMNLVSSNNKWWLNSQMGLDIHIQLHTLGERSFTVQHPTHGDFTVRADTNWNWSIILTSLPYNYFILSSIRLFSKIELSIEKKRWQRNPLVSHSLPPFSCHPWISWGCTPSLMKTLNKTRSNYTPLFSGLQPDAETLTPGSSHSDSFQSASLPPHPTHISTASLWRSYGG